jgi:hypothetical protein
MDTCPLCGANTRDRYGDLRHEGCCPHFMRGPDAGGDPYEWPTIMDAIEETETRAAA